jgi:hypothetical protein
VSEGSARGAALVAWLDRRAEAAPASLRPRLAESVRATAAGSGASLVELSSRAGERLLARLLEHGCGPRSAAPDLLAADALVTYAFEAAAEDESMSARAIEASAAEAMARIAALGGNA